MHGIVHGVLTQALSSVHHLAYVETIKPEERSHLEHLPPVFELAQVLISRLEKTALLPNLYAMSFEDLSCGFLQEDDVPLFANHRS
jgi:hypothetical protein